MVLAPEPEPLPEVKYESFVPPATYAEKLEFIQKQDVIGQIALTGNVEAGQVLGAYLLGHEPVGIGETEQEFRRMRSQGLVPNVPYSVYLGYQKGTYTQGRYYDLLSAWSE